MVLTVADLEADEQRSCDKCTIIGRGVRSYMPSSNKNLRLHFSHRGTKLCCGVEGELGWALILEFTPDNGKFISWLLLRP